MLLEVEDLHSHFQLENGDLKAVDGISFTVGEGEALGIVGESGCGKTIVALSLLRLVPPPGRIVSGGIRWRGEDLLAVPPARLREIRGGEIGLVFQEPGAALNPVIPVGRQIVEVLQAHRAMGRREAEAEAVRWLGQTGIPEPERRARSYPFEFSGGMKQRVVIALAACAGPRMLIADEPTTALDVTVQAEIVDLLMSLREEHGMAILIISHDLGVITRMAQRVLVMYTGKVFESGPTEQVFRNPRHPYTQGLIASVPRLGAGRDDPLHGIPGAVPDLLDLPSGCTFHPRCHEADETCEGRFPPLELVDPAAGQIGRRHCACYKR